MSATVRIGLVGVGMAGKFHLACLKRVHGVNVQVVGVTSRRAESREAFAAEHGLTAFDSVEAMLDHVDAIIICSPPHAHQQQILLAASHGKHVLCEKPLTGFFGPSGADTAFRGDLEPKGPMLDAVRLRLAELRQAVESSGIIFGYAENFVYAPSVQKERQLIQQSGAQLLRMIGEESHSGSHSGDYGIWARAGGGSLMGKGCHPLTALLYLKRCEQATTGKLINSADDKAAAPAHDLHKMRPQSVTARTHKLTRLPDYRDAGLLRTKYHDIEDYGWMHVTFGDGTVADVVTGETTLGGIYDYLEIFANNHRARCRLNPVSMLDFYNPRHEQLADAYLVEKLSSNEGWSPVSANEHYTMGYQGEVQDFVECVAEGRRPICDLDLAIDTTLVIYAAYLSDQQGGAEVKLDL